MLSLSALDVVPQHLWWGKEHITPKYVLCIGRSIGCSKNVFCFGGFNIRFALSDLRQLQRSACGFICALGLEELEYLCGVHTELKIRQHIMSVTPKVYGFNAL